MTRADPPESRLEETGQTAGAHNLSVLKAVALIGCFIDSPDGKTLSQLARRTGLHVSSAFRILRTLTATGVLYRHAGEERYVAGPMLLALAGSIHGTGGYGRVIGILRDLAAETGESTSLGIRDGSCVSVIFASPAPQLPRVEHRPGARINLHCSAMGKAMLAHGNDAAVRQRVAGLGTLQPMTPHSITDPAVLLGELDAVRERSYAISRNEHCIGVTSLAVVVPGPQNTARAALGVQVPISRWEPDAEARLAGILKVAADRLGELGEMSRIPAT
ncbi:MAG: IclR family transcriptional regulator [Rhodobacter sp.]|nr:IclR family transcriptional regulator [Rhodobacter sp.]